MGTDSPVSTPLQSGSDDDDDDVDDDDSHQVGLPSTGITVFGSQLHTHGTGRKVGHHHTDHHCWS